MIRPSGNALPTAITVNPKYVVLILAIRPIYVNKSTNKPEHNLVHKIPIYTLNKTIKRK